MIGILLLRPLRKRGVGHGSWGTGIECVAEDALNLFVHSKPRAGVVLLDTV